MSLKTHALLAAALILTVFNDSASAASEKLPEGAKGLFFEQMNRPGVEINTGVQYWIELHRSGQVKRVNNKTSFTSGDRIKFHVKPNINGYAYIVLKSGSRGEQSVLFPDPARREDNQIVRGRPYVLPADGYLTFDDNPGIEKVSLLLSRTPLDARAYLGRQATERILIASAATGAKDLIPAKILLAYSPPATSPVKPAASPPVKATSQSKRKPQTGKASWRNSSKKPVQSRKGKSRSDRSTPAEAVPVEIAPAVGSDHEERLDESGTVTVVRNDPTGVLAVDVDLQHI